MTNFNAGYVPPGVYVSSDSSGTVGAVGITDTVLCLVGRGIGYDTYTEAISFAGGNSQVLTKQGVNVATVVVTSPSGAAYVGGVGDTTHDYALVVTGSGDLTITNLNRETGGTIPSGGTVVVTYQFTDPHYFALNSFTDFGSFQDVYGVPFDPTTGALLSPLSVAAQLAFQNGASVIYAVALTGSGSVASQFSAALALTTPNFNINLIVPLYETAVDGTTANSFIATLETFINGAEANGQPMIALVGLPQAFTGATPDTIATAVANRRIILTWPQAFLFYNGIINNTITLDGIYFAAAAAGLLANNQFNRGLTRAQINGFSGISAAIQQTMTNTAKNLWSSKGVSVAEIDRNNNLVIRHGVTTDPSSVQNREISIVREEDALFDLIQVSLNQAGLIGQPIVAQTPLAVKGIIAQALETLLTNNTIQAYTNLLVKQEALPGGDPTVIQCTFQWKPTYPLNYITVLFSIDLNTGTLTSDTAAVTSSS